MIATSATQDIYTIVIIIILESRNKRLEKVTCFAAHFIFRLQILQTESIVSCFTAHFAAF